VTKCYRNRPLNPSGLGEFGGEKGEGMRIVAVREQAPGELRVAITPESAKGLIQDGFEVAVEADAGIRAGFRDVEYRDQGVAVERDRAVLLSSADAWLVVDRPELAEVGQLRSGAWVVGFLRPFDLPEAVREFASRKVTSLAIELLPRTTRAQVMDALSSQASIAGYRAVILAASYQTKILPMMTTPAGTIPPARVLVVGAGVAGLQAIATAHRLGARVEAYDTRPAVKEQVESLGARFLELSLDAGDAETAGGYAKAQTEEFLNRQRELLGERLGDFDIVVLTALVQGQPAPLLINRKGVEHMQPGSVVMDLAAATGGNCELTLADQEVVHEGVRIFGPTKLAAESARGASRMYSRNLLALLRHLKSGAGQLALDLDDEITRGVLLSRDGEMVNPTLRERWEARAS